MNKTLTRWFHIAIDMEKYYICCEKEWNHSWEYLALSLMHLILNVPSFLFFIKYAYKYFWKTTPNNDEQSYSSKNRYEVEGDSKALRGLYLLIKCSTQYNLVTLFPWPQCLITHPISCSLSSPPPSVKKQKQTKKIKPQIKYPNKPKPQKNGKMSKQQNSGVHFVLAKYFWVWSLFWNVVNIHRDTFPFPSRHRL